MKAWKTDLPDSDIDVIVRMDSEDYPVGTASHNGEEWIAPDGFACEYPVTGWLHIHEAAAILDAFNR